MADIVAELTAEQSVFVGMRVDDRNRVASSAEQCQFGFRTKVRHVVAILLPENGDFGFFEVLLGGVSIELGSVHGTCVASQRKRRVQVNRKQH